MERITQEVAKLCPGPEIVDQQRRMIEETAEAVNKATHLLEEIDRRRAIKSPQRPE
jgi:hypothetical protein